MFGAALDKEVGDVELQQTDNGVVPSQLLDVGVQQIVADGLLQGPAAVSARRRGNRALLREAYPFRPGEQLGAEDLRREAVAEVLVQTAGDSGSLQAADAGPLQQGTAGAAPPQGFGAADLLQDFGAVDLLRRIDAG